MLNKTTGGKQVQNVVSLRSEKRGGKKEISAPQALSVDICDRVVRSDELLRVC